METKADVVFWRARHLWAGGHEVSYRATAVTSGVFVLPPAVAESEEQPELMGSSASLQFLVHEEELSDDTVAPLLQVMVSTRPVLRPQFIICYVLIAMLFVAASGGWHCGARG